MRSPILAAGLPPHRPTTASLLLGLLIVGTACRDDALAPVSLDAPEPAIQPVTFDDQIKIVKRFAIQLDASGAFRPGLPIDLTARVAAPFGATNAVIAVAAPEMEAAKASGWREDFRLPENVRIASVATWSNSIARGASNAYTATIRPERPGYYRVVVTASEAEHQIAHEDGKIIDDMVAAEFWLHVSNDGGGLHSKPDLSVFPEGSTRTLGPFRAARRSSPTSGSKEAAATSGPTRYRLMYYHPHERVYLPVPYAKLQMDIYDMGTYWGTSYTGFDGEGYAMPQCPMSGMHYDMKALLNNSSVQIVPFNHWDGEIIGGDNMFPDQCELGDVQMLACCGTSSERAHIYVTMSQVAGNSWNFFGVSRPKINVLYNPNADANSYSTSDEITIVEAWGPQGIFAQGHEYGHALHHKSLGGVVSSRDDCPNTTFHPYDQQQSLRCGLGEGFASYHAVAVMGSASEYFDAIENDTMLDAGEDGAIVPHAVSAFLFDLTDNRVEAHDAVTYPGRYVADIVRTCLVRYGFTWLRALGITT